VRTTSDQGRNPAPSHTKRWAPAVESEFRRVYQQPGRRYLQLAYLLAAAGVATLGLFDVVYRSQAFFPPIQWVRAAIVASFVFGYWLVTWRKQFVGRHFTLIVNVTVAVAMAFASLAPILVHGSAPDGFYFSLSNSLAATIIVTYTFSRLPVANTAWIVVAGSLLGIATAAVVPIADGRLFARLVFFLAFVNVASYTLARTVERRERELFLLAKENLSRNLYAKELEAARALAEEANAVKLRFLANMSHEFQTPLSGVIQTLDLAAKSDDLELCKLARSARHAGDSLLGTLNSILDYTRWTQQEVTPSLDEVDIPQTVRRLVQLATVRAREKNIDVSLRLDMTERDSVACLDQVMFAEILTRLLDNAVRFTSRGHIDVNVEFKRRAASDGSPGLEVTVSDTGVGIPSFHVHQIFTPFYQVNDASNRLVGGTGLGLAIVKRLVELMQGTIDVSGRPAGGTAFTFWLPVRRSLGAPSFPRHASRSGGGKPPGWVKAGALSGRVLLVEDNQFNAELAAKLLVALGVSVDVATDGADAVRAAAGGRFDVILMDCQMPVMDGYEATRRIRDNERASNARPTPIVAVTANALAGDRERCLAAGMDDYLAKPYSVEQLAEKLSIWLVADCGLTCGAWQRWRSRLRIGPLSNSDHGLE
jgi:signal transduction histidine kinase/CheY-like chemotaxis protein